MNNAQYFINKYNMQPHPEGGYFAETYRAQDEILYKDTGKHYSASTAILFMLVDDNVSCWHRITQDELWHFHTGNAIEVHTLSKDKGHVVHHLGSPVEHGDQYSFQLVVPKNTWFAAKIHTGTGFSLVGCTVAPGFEFADFEMASAAQIESEFGQKVELDEFTHKE